VVLQTQLVYEASSAELTFELRGRCMYDIMVEQVVDSGEGFPTFYFFRHNFVPRHDPAETYVGSTEKIH
jgi:hypothetical protein